MRWADGARGVRRAREPDWVVIRTRCWSELFGGEEGEGGRRVIVEVKCPVWKVVWCRRRWPDRDLGSSGVC